MQPIALTFDDGPHPIWTREILGALNERAIRATFFVWGEQAAKHPEVVRETLDQGHSVQPHCWSHVSHRNLNESQIEEDINRVVSLLGELSAPAPHLWRPPWGRVRRPGTKRIADGVGLELAGWTIDSSDWRGLDATGMTRIVRKGIARSALGPRPKPGLRANPGRMPVVLMHDSFLEPTQAANRSTCAETVALVRGLLDDGQLRFAPLEHGLNDGLAGALRWPVR